MESGGKIVHLGRRLGVSWAKNRAPASQQVGRVSTHSPGASHVVMARRYSILSLSIVLIAALAIVSTYRLFSQTYDEPAHIAAGMQWLARGRFTYEAQHPPLARVLAAAGPYLAGERGAAEFNQYDEGLRILGSGAHYRRTLALARLGELPFFLLLCISVGVWGKRLYGDAGAVLSVLFVATNPNLLAHAGLATIDMAPTAMMVVSLYAYARWVERFRVRDALFLGLALGISAVTKFSVIAFLGLSILGAEVLRVWWAKRSQQTASEGVKTFAPGQAALALGVAAVAVWATYRFDVGRVDQTWPFAVPAPQFFLGLEEFVGHGVTGTLLGYPPSAQAAYLLGRTSNAGWWFYYPVALAVKTPLPLMVLSIVGIAATVIGMRRQREQPRTPADRTFEALLPVLGMAAILAIAMRVDVDIGVRLVLPIYPLMALLATAGTLPLWNMRTNLRTRRNVGRVVVGGLIASAVVIPIAAYPDYLAYFNPLAGPSPDHVLVDSNLDWGQDLYRLKAASDSIGIDTLNLGYFGSADPIAVGLRNARPLRAYTPTKGWVAVSRTWLAGESVGNALAWLKAYRPVERVGPSLLLYHIER